MYPADGAMADKPLCGRLLIPRDYPNVPPVMHLLTTTNRYNVDVYRGYAEPSNLQYLHSSMCFDILKSKNNGGIWEPDYTLSALISSLLQTIVSVNVLQTNGTEVKEFVSMEKLGSIHKNVEMTYNQYKAIMPTRREIVHVEGVQVETKHLKFPEQVTSLKNNQDLIIESGPIFLQLPDDKMKENVYTIGFDLTDLKANLSTVFSIILSNAPKDPLGKKAKTILMRNGVTATAAKKKEDGITDWFYHGKPMNQDDLKLIVTIGYNQFCISYLENDRKIVHGDSPVSFLTPDDIGKVAKQPFYLSVLLKNKGGPSINVKTFLPTHGYVHPVAFNN
jgi:ubiquitin-protein ligase